jgi:hypothetical protein
MRSSHRASRVRVTVGLATRVALSYARAAVLPFRHVRQVYSLGILERSGGLLTAAHRGQWRTERGRWRRCDRLHRRGRLATSAPRLGYRHPVRSWGRRMPHSRLSDPSGRVRPLAFHARRRCILSQQVQRPKPDDPFSEKHHASWWPLANRPFRSWSIQFGRTEIAQVDTLIHIEEARMSNTRRC